MFQPDPQAIIHDQDYKSEVNAGGYSLATRDDAVIVAVKIMVPRRTNVSYALRQLKFLSSNINKLDKH